MGAGSLALWDEQRQQRGSNVPMDAAEAGGSTYYERGLGEGAGFYELGRLFLAEDRKLKGVVPEGRRWTRGAAEAELDRLFANRTVFELSGKRNEAITEVLRMQYGLEMWANDKPEGYVMPEIVLESELVKELEDSKEQFRKAGQRGGSGDAPSAAEPMVASPAAAASGGDEMKQTTAATDPRIAALLEEEEGEDPPTE